LQCNGKHPVCSRCREGGLKCQYDVSSERITKMANLKAKVTQLGRSVGDLELVLESLRLSSDDEAAALLARLRLGESPVELVRSLKAGELVHSSGTVPFSQRRTPADAVLSPSPSDMGSCEDDDELQVRTNPAFWRHPSGTDVGLGVRACHFSKCELANGPSFPGIPRLPNSRERLDRRNGARHRWRW